MRVRSFGYSLFELMVVVSMISIVASVAVPGMNEMMSRNRLISVTSNIHRVFKIARGEAVKRREAVLIKVVKKEWQATIGEDVIARFSNKHSDINISPLPTLTITPVGGSDSAVITISDNHPLTSDRCIHILRSGQSSLGRGDDC